MKRFLILSFPIILMSPLSAKVKAGDNMVTEPTIYRTATVRDSVFMNHLFFVLENPQSIRDSDFISEYEKLSNRLRYLDISLLRLTTFNHDRVKDRYRTSNRPYPDITGIDFNGVYIFIGFTDQPEPTMGYMVDNRGKYIYFSSSYNAFDFIKPQTKTVKLKVIIDCLPCESWTNLCLHYLDGEFHVADYDKSTTIYRIRRLKISTRNN